MSDDKYTSYAPVSVKLDVIKEELSNVQNGFMIADTMTRRPAATLTTSSVEYYFDVLTDASVNQTVACQGLEAFDKGAYLIDFDFECETQTTQATFYDIYGSVTEPEICQD